MSMDDIKKLKSIPPIGSTLVDTLDIDNLLNIKEISSESHVILDVTNSRIFCELTPGTDLNEPPANWLYPSVNLPNPINIKQNNEESASFYIANMFPECNNKVSMVADAEVIKKLFKIPYNKESVSLMVRKIGNILLLDNFDIANFSSNQEITEETKLSQVEEYLTKLQELNTNLRKAKHSNKKLRERNMFSKFLFRSVADDTVGNEVSDDSTSADSLPNHSEKSGRVRKFGRIIYWTFEETQMLIGTNTLKQYFFGRGSTRNVSLHVTNAGKPLKIAHAIDMWLDNLICDIPEAVICFQLGGIVKQYECIRTQNISHLLGSQFSITKIKAFVKEISSFLLNQKFQRSQIYWLSKCKNDNDIKFFNLNMLEANDEIQSIKTPFGFEFGKLCYRFGHNQYYYANTEVERNEWTNTMLLEVSMKTLNRKIHPEIIATANYLIVHLSFSYEIFKTSLFVKCKAEFQNCKKQPETVTNRCLDALNNINDGLECLQYFCVSSNIVRKIVKKNSKSNNSFKFNFKSKKTKKQDEVIYINISSLFPKKDHGVFEALPTWQNINEDRDYWKNYLKFLFYQKAELVFGILAQQYFYCDMFGLCLHSLNMMVRSNKIKMEIDPSSHSIPINPVLIMAGDCCQSFSTVNVPKNFMTCSSDHNNVKKMVNVFIADEKYYKIDTNINYGLQMNLKNCTKVKIIEKAIEFYKESLKYEEMDLIRKKLFVSNLALCKLYCNELDKARKQTNRLHYFEQSEKYLNQACDDTARLPLDQAYALFHRVDLHDLLYNIYLDEMITSYSVENNLLVHCKKLLDSFKQVLLIFNTSIHGDNKNCMVELEKYFCSFISSITKTLRILRNDIINSQIPDNLRNLMYDCLRSDLIEIYRECALYQQRYKDILSNLSCAVITWCISCSFIELEKIGITLIDNMCIKRNLCSAIYSFTQLSASRFYMLALCDRTTYIVDKLLRIDYIDVSLSEKIQDIKSVLQVFGIAGTNFQKIIDSDFKDKWFPTINSADEEFFNTRVFLNQIKNLLIRGIELITPYSEEKEEIDTFKSCLRLFEGSINQDMDIRLFLTALIPKLEAMCTTMKIDTHVVYS